MSVVDTLINLQCGGAVIDHKQLYMPWVHLANYSFGEENWFFTQIYKDLYDNSIL